MTKDDVAYFYHRAERELSRAEASDVPEAVRAHYTLAGYYLDRVYSDPDASMIVGALAGNLTAAEPPP